MGRRLQWYANRNGPTNPQVTLDATLAPHRPPTRSWKAYLTATATRRAQQARPAVRIVVLTTFDDDDHLYPALAAGACGFLTKDASPAELLDGIRRAAAGDSPYSTAVLGRLVEQALASWSPPSQAEPTPEFTPRERDVLALLGAGLTNTEIAARLGIGVTTVKTHVVRLMERSGSPNRVHLALLAVRLGVAATDT